MELDLKIVGWGPPHKPTVRRLELFADWIEAQAFLLGAGAFVSKPELVDRLEESSLVGDSDDGWRLVDDAFAVCRARKKQIGASYPFSLAGGNIELQDPDAIVYLFCLLVSLPEQLKTLRTSLPVDFRDIFEAVVHEALSRALPGWNVYMTGWSHIADGGKSVIVSRVADWVLAKQKDEEVFPHANDAQVDIAAVLSFGDGRSALPVILGQCATGVTDWKQKASRPNLDRWHAAVQFPTHPTKLFAVPFALDGKSFMEATWESRGLVLDRARICAHLPVATPQLGARICEWMKKPEVRLPTAA